MSAGLALDPNLTDVQFGAKSDFIEMMKKVQKDVISSEQIGSETEYYDEDGLVILSVETVENEDDPSVEYRFTSVYAPDTFIIREKA